MDDDGLMALLSAAETCGAESVLTAMGKHVNAQVAQDVPAAAEMFGLLRHFLGRLPHRELDAGRGLALAPGVYQHQEHGHVVALVPVGSGELEFVAYWISQSVQSPKLLAMPGLLALPFSIEEHDGQRWLIPEWFAVFYVDSDPGHCVPLLALRSVLDDGRFSDWVTAALVRATVAFGLPTGDASRAVEQVIIEKSSAA